MDEYLRRKQLMQDRENKNKRAVKGYIISGRKLFSKLDDKEIEDYDRFFLEFKEGIENEIDRKLSEKEEYRLYFLILGIMKKHNEYDDRYDRYLLGYVIND